MSRISQNPVHWNITRKLLGWMICARRPLKWHEIQGVVSTDLVEQSVNFDERKLRLHIRDLCGSLVQVLRGDRVELVHSTAKLSVKDLLPFNDACLIVLAVTSLIVAMCAHQLSIATLLLCAYNISHLNASIQMSAKKDSSILHGKDI